MPDVFRPLPRTAVALLPGRFSQREGIARGYIASLRSDNLLQNHYHEAGLWFTLGKPDGIHGGWEEPACEVRGHFLGHWMSAAAELAARNNDDELRGKVRHVVKELGRCQRENGGEWVASIPEKFLHWVANGTPRWSPVYVAHKTLMGLYDTWAALQDEEALDILTNAAKWFHRWTGSLSKEQLEGMLEHESGCIMETWADLYGVTGDQSHLELVERFCRHALFDPLRAGRDALTNRHANTTIPEALGAARAFEVTGESYWRDMAIAYWESAVTLRGSFATGGQTYGECWTPPFELSARLGVTNQEHCTVYNMMRLAEVLLRWTGDAKYASYREYNLVNGILAQQHPRTSMVNYYLGLGPGSRKNFVTPTEDFPCCQGTMVQAGSRHAQGLCYETNDGLALAYLAPMHVSTSWNGERIDLKVKTPDSRVPLLGLVPMNAPIPAHRPNHDQVSIEVRAAVPLDLELLIRIPDWIAAPATVLLNGESIATGVAPGFCSLRRTWQEDDLTVLLPRALRTVPLPDRADTVAFADGPLALAGICDETFTVRGSADDADSLIERAAEWDYDGWRDRYRFRPDAGDGYLLPLRDIVDETYTVYFPLRAPR